MLQGWQPLYDKVERRRRHFYADASADPRLGKSEGGRPQPGDPYAEVSRYQTDKLRQKAVEWVSRVAERHVIYDVVLPGGPEDAKNKDTGATIAETYNAWMMDTEERTAPPLFLQDALAWGQVRDPYAILHSRWATDLWPELEREYTTEKPMGDAAKRFEPLPKPVEVSEPCEACAGTGEQPGPDPDYPQTAMCPECGGEKMKSRTQARYIEHGDAYDERMRREYAGDGSPWHDEVIDFMQFVPEIDNSPRKGLRRALVHFEVDLSTYTDAERDNISAEELRAVAKAPGDSHSSSGHSTPSSEQSGAKVTVYQLWTRSHCYEWASHDEAKVKGWAHRYKRGVPFWILPVHDTGHPDPVWRFECPLEGMYRTKEYVDRAWTITAAAVEGQANPLTTTVDKDGPGYLPPMTLDPTGNPTSVGGSEAGRNEATTGEKKTLSFPMPQSVPQWLELIDAAMDKAAPETGRAEIDKNTQPWTAKQAQAQANIGPGNAIKIQRVVFQDNIRFKHEQHIEENIPLIAFARDDDGNQRLGEPLFVAASELARFNPVALIDTSGENQRITDVEYTAAMVERGFGTDEDVYKAQGHDDVGARALEVEVWKIMQPLRAERIRQEIAARMGTRFVLGPMGEMIGPGGVDAGPEGVAAATGIKPGPQQVARKQAEAAAAATSPIARTAGAQTSMPNQIPALPREAPSI